jgi:hypothetical protein
VKSCNVPKGLRKLAGPNQLLVESLHHLHGQRDVGGQHPSSPGPAPVSRRVRQRREGGRCRHDLQRLHARRSNRPRDAGLLDVVGFDTTMPAVIADFVRE